MLELGSLFQCLSLAPAQIDETVFDMIEKFVVRLYKKGSPTARVDKARMQMFCQGKRSLDNVPPTQCALLQHTRVAVYQAGHIWGQSQVKDPVVPAPDKWGWQRDGEATWVPLWSTQPEAAKGVRALLKCSCKMGCGGRCGCAKANMRCTQMCNCAGQCKRA